MVDWLVDLLTYKLIDANLSPDVPSVPGKPLVMSFSSRTVRWIFIHLPLIRDLQGFLHLPFKNLSILRMIHFRLSWAPPLNIHSSPVIIFQIDALLQKDFTRVHVTTYHACAVTFLMHGKVILVTTHCHTIKNALFVSTKTLFAEIF